jgi:hypothetical protein
MIEISMGHDFTRAVVIEDCVLRSPVRVKVTGKGTTMMLLKIWGVSDIGSPMR